ncbi:hypothetical protein [Telluribacter sp. SYSU D00476]|uniref:hypothetical protein n=1 Tax=Telluribacter sp. SYSU D00476 TaxID=2811430 RepID=UPI001FF58203|nr:hypothetical protein [Telluribacter sp. SYSU D00476]
MKPYSEYSAEELAMERLFIRWVRYPNDLPIRAFWENWLIQHPHMDETVTVARQLVETSSALGADVLSGEEVGSLWNKIRTSIEQMPDVEPLDAKLKTVATNWYIIRWSVAVLTAFVMVLLWYFLQPAHSCKALLPFYAKANSVQATSPADSLKKPFTISKNLTD